VDPLNVAADKKVYDLMKAEVFKCLKFMAARRAAQRVPDRPILPDLNVEGIPHLEPRGPEDRAQVIQPITEAVRWWRGTNTYGKFRYWSRYVGLPFHIYKQMRVRIPCEDGEEECIYDEYLVDVGPLYGLPESLETDEI
jgi:hypothetical protein